MSKGKSDFDKGAERTLGGCCGVVVLLFAVAAILLFLTTLNNMRG